MSLMFQSATRFNGVMNNWNTTMVTNMKAMFQNAIKFKQSEVAVWNVENVTNLESMFQGASSFDHPLDWTISAPNLNRMFSGARSFDQDLGDWDISGVSHMTEMLDSTGLSRKNYDATLSKWVAQNVQSNVTLGAYGLQYCEAEDDRDSLILNNGWIITGDLNPCSAFITTWQTDLPGSSSSTSIRIPTTGTGYLYGVDWENDGIIDDTGVTGTIIHDYGAAGTYQVAIYGDFPRIHFGGSNGGDRNKIISIDNWGDIEWNTMRTAFTGCQNLVYGSTDTPDLSSVTDLSYMFAECSNFNGNISNWSTDSITNMQGVFYDASSFNQPLYWNTENVQDMVAMFYNATSFNQPLDWNTSNVIFMDLMFYSATSFDQPLDWNTSNVTVMSHMFFSADNFNQDLSNWNISSVINMIGMFNNSNLSRENYDKTLIGWTAQSVQTNVDLGADGLEYCIAEDARQKLIDNHGWTISGDMRDCGNYCSSLATITFDGPSFVPSDWSESNNWDLNRVPNACDKVMIPADKMVTLDTAAHSYTIDISEGATLDTDTFSLSVWVFTLY